MRGIMAWGAARKGVKWQVTTFVLSGNDLVWICWKSARGSVCSSLCPPLYSFLPICYSGMGIENLDTTHSSEFYPLNSDPLLVHLSYNEKSWGCEWKMHLTRLAVGLIFFVSTFFSAVNLLTDSWAIFSLEWKQGGGRGEEDKKGEEKRKEERGQVKQKSKCCWINQLAVWKYKERFSVLFITKFKLWEGDSSGLSKLNFLHWLRGSPGCLWGSLCFCNQCGRSFWSMEY